MTLGDDAQDGRFFVCVVVVWSGYRQQHAYRARHELGASATRVDHRHAGERRSVERRQHRRAVVEADGAGDESPGI